jgi:hypothetical protein
MGTKADLFWRDASPSRNMTWTSMGTTNGCLCKRSGGEHAKEFRELADVLRTAEGRMAMQVTQEGCCGLEVHKKSATACVLGASGRRQQTGELQR